MSPQLANAVPGDNLQVDSKDLKKGATILFQGDSITDAGRNRKDNNANSQGALGAGYAFLAASHLLHTKAPLGLKCYNKGISGNKVFQLSNRWDRDCLLLKPGIVSILIGVNDFWHTLDGGYEGTAKRYEDDFRRLVKRTQKALPEAQIIIGEPFVILEGSAVDKERWLPEFRNYQQAAKKIARESSLAFIPYQSVFDKASKKVSPVYWAKDGVHPTVAGSHLMAQAWLETFRRM